MLIFTVSGSTTSMLSVFYPWSKQTPVSSAETRAFLDHLDHSMTTESEPPPVAREIEFYADENQEPFPLLNLANVPRLLQASENISLVSSVLRDSELVMDKQLKQAVLYRTLIAWAVIVDLFPHDEGYASLIRSLVSDLLDDLSVSIDQKKELEVRFERSLRLLLAFNGISSTLAWVWQSEMAPL